MRLGLLLSITDRVKEIIHSNIPVIVNACPGCRSDQMLKHFLENDSIF